jgi:hypothetical protein
VDYTELCICNYSLSSSAIDEQCPEGHFWRSSSIPHASSELPSSTAVSVSSFLRMSSFSSSSQGTSSFSSKNKLSLVTTSCLLLLNLFILVISALGAGLSSLPSSRHLVPRVAPRLLQGCVIPYHVLIHGPHCNVIRGACLLWPSIEPLSLQCCVHPTLDKITSRSN